MEKRRVYPRELKIQAVAEAEKGEKTISQIAMDFNLNESMLRRWIHQVKEAADNGFAAFPGHGCPIDEELFNLRKENKRLETENKILKDFADFVEKGGSEPR